MHAANHRVGVVVAPANIPVVSEVGANRWSPLHVDSGIDQRTVMALGGSIHRKDAPGA